MTTLAMSLRGVKGGLCQFLANKLRARKGSTAISLENAPGPADKQHIGKLVRWWMKHDPVDASRRMVDAVGLGGAYHLPESERLRLARAFLAMLDIDATFEGDETAARGPTSPWADRSTSRSRTN